jgi:DNA-binding PadR family transcriptional regulator
MERELLLLGLLRHEDMHGYRLVERIERDLSTCADVKKPTAYFLLAKLAKAGLIARSRSREGKRPPKWVYRLTAEGEAAFQRLLRENLEAHLPAKFAGDVGLAFLEALGVDEAAEHLLRRRSAIAEALEGFQAAPEHPGSLGLVLSHQRLHLASELSWVDSVLTWLRQSDPKLGRPAKHGSPPPATGEAS